MRDNLGAAVVRLIVFGVVCLLGTFALLAVYAQFRFEHGKTYTAIFGNVTGLAEGNFVLVVGVEVGKVSHIMVIDDSTASGGLLSVEARTQLCVDVGAGDQDSAIIAVLTSYVVAKATMAPDLKNMVDTWIDGYRGADLEPFLGDLTKRITLADSCFGEVPRALPG